METKQKDPNPNGGKGATWFALALICLFTIPAILSPRVSSGRGSHSQSQAKSELSELVGAIEQFQLDCGRYPTDQEGLKALVVDPKDMSTWHGPYLRRDTSIDPWGNPYNYRRIGKGYEIKSYGADGKPGGEGNDADITNGSDS